MNNGTRISLCGKVFRVMSNDGPGDSDNESRFYFNEHDDVVYASYFGGNIKFGTLVALWEGSKNLNVYFQQFDFNGVMKYGEGFSTVKLMASGKVRLVENWKFTNEKDLGRGGRIIFDEV